MVKILQKSFPSLSLKLRAIKILILNKDSFLYSVGWINSIKHINSVDADGNPVPWMNYSFVEFLTKRLKKDFRLFEFGSGNSTLYLSKFLKEIISVEYDSKWFDIINPQLPVNAKLVFVQADIDGNYCRSARNTHKTFEIIIVDGRDRINCLMQSISSLTSDGVLILDDSHEEKYNEANSILENSQFKSLTISGFKPFSSKIASSTIFYRTNNILGL